MKEENVWNIQSLYDLQFFNCPSCTYKNNLKQEFVNHAYELHPESDQYLKNITDGSLSDVEIPNSNIKDEFDQDLVSYPSNELDIKIGQCEKIEDGIDFKIESIENSVDHHVNNGDIYCDHCDLDFCNLSSLQDHIRLLHLDNSTANDEKYKCKTCAKTFLKKKLFNTHLLTHEKEGKRKCDFCDKEEFGNKNALKLHLMSDHREIAAKYKCEICEKKFMEPNDLYQHTYRNHNNKKKEYKCAECDKCFSRKESLNKHVLSAHVVNPELNTKVPIIYFIEGRSPSRHKKRFCI